MIKTKRLSPKKIKKLQGKKWKIIYISGYQITIEVDGETILINPGIYEDEDVQMATLEFKKML